METFKTKVCKYCGNKFSEIDFPATFERTVTCSSVRCAGMRRKERIGKKNN